MGAQVRESDADSNGPKIAWWCALAAALIHAAILFGWHLPAPEPSVLAIEGDAVEVGLVESTPAVTAPALPPPNPPPPVEPPSEPQPEPPKPEPIPVPKPLEMTVPQPATPPPVPKTIPKPAAVTKPAAPARSSPHSGNVPNPNSASRGTTGPANAGTAPVQPAGKPAFASRPAPAYPPESRAAGEQGVVILRITVNAGGRPTAVQVARSSGFPRLDRAAVEGGWRARVVNASAGTQIEAPVRFNLHN